MGWCAIVEINKMGDLDELDESLIIQWKLGHYNKSKIKMASSKLIKDAKIIDLIALEIITISLKTSLWSMMSNSRGMKKWMW